jgi:hypothetical protein
MRIILRRRRPGVEEGTIPTLALAQVTFPHAGAGQSTLASERSARWRRASRVRRLHLRQIETEQIAAVFRRGVIELFGLSGAGTTIAE